MKIRKRILAAGLTVVLLLGCFGFSITASAVTQEEIDALKAQADELNGRIGDVQTELDRLAAEENKTIAHKAVYDEQCTLLGQQIQNTKLQIEGYESMVEEARQQLADAQEKEADQRNLMVTRLRAMEESGTVSYLSILFGARSFRDMLSRLDFIREIMQYDQSVIAAYQAYQQTRVDREADLKALIAESEKMTEDLKQQQAVQIKNQEEAVALMLEIQADTEEYEKMLNLLAEEEEELQAEITAKEEEYAEELRRIEEERQRQEEERRRQEEASHGGGGSPGSGYSSYGLIWPVNSRRITSYFGGRESPGGIGSTNHMGIDIGNVGYDTPVMAAADGIVTASMLSSSAGNYVAISHGGMTTKYMHMSTRYVSFGEYVSQGQIIGITGSTGNSTGPHLHFGVIIDGNYVDPLSVLP